MEQMKTLTIGGITFEIVDEQMRIANDTNTTEITNIKRAITHEPYATDNSTAYTKVVPENDLPSVAEVSMLGGMSRKCTNLLNPSKVSAGANTTISNGVVTQYAADTNNSPYFKCMRFNGSTYLNASFSNTVTSVGRNGVSFEKTAEVTEIRFGLNGTARDTLVRTDVSHLPNGTYYVSVDFTNATQGSFSWKDMQINEGSTAIPYEPYFGGLASAKVTEVESVGVNLLNPDWRKSSTINGVAFTKNADGSITANGTATGDIFYDIANGDVLEPSTSYYASLGDDFVSDSTKMLGVIAVVNGHNTFLVWGSDGVFVTPANLDTAVVRIRAYAGAVFNNETLYPMLAKSTVAVPYTPYVRNTLPIPEAVQALDGYGDGVNESVYNYIDFEKKQFVKRVGKVDMGTLEWGYYSPGFFSIDRQKNITNIATGYNLICDCYKTISPRLDPEMAGAPDLSICSHTAGVWLSVKDTKYGNDVNAFTSGVSGSMLYYELATPEVTDISDVLPNSIEVEGGGTITFKNEHKLEMLSDVSYHVQAKRSSLSYAEKMEIAEMVAAILSEN